MATSVTATITGWPTWPLHTETQMTPLLTVLGIALIIVAIPFGLMLAPLAIGSILVVFGLRRLDGLLEDPRAGQRASAA